MSQISLSTTFLADQSTLRQALDFCENSMITSIEIGSNHSYESDYSYVKNYSFEYLVHNYFPVPKESFVVNIASLDDNIHQRSIKHIKSSIDFCYKINSKLYTFHLDVHGLYRVDGEDSVCVTNTNAEKKLR